MVLEQKLSWNCFKNNSIFFHLSPTTSHFHPLQVENCDSKSRLIVDEDDNGKLRFERVKPAHWDDINFCFQFCNEVVYPTDHDFIYFQSF